MMFQHHPLLMVYKPLTTVFLCTRHPNWMVLLRICSFLRLLRLLRPESDMNYFMK